MKIVKELGTDIDRNWTLVGGDFGTVSQHENIVQSIQNRISCRLDALKIFYAEYGSNVQDYLGWKNIKSTREYIRIEIISTLKQDPRIQDFLISMEENSSSNIASGRLQLVFTDETTFDGNLVILKDGSVNIIEEKEDGK